MRVEREPIFHDRQTVEVIGPLTTTSSTFVDIPGAALTTKDLSQDARYLFTITLELQHSNNNSSINLRTTIDTVPATEKTISFGPNSSNSPLFATFVGSATLQAEQVIQIQWNTPSGTATLNLIEIIMDGIPNSRIV